MQEFMGVVLGSAVVPIAMCVTWSKANKWGCIGGAVAGFLVALRTGWVIAIVLVPAAIVGIPLLLTPPPAAASVEKLEALEREEEKLEAEGFYDSEEDMVRTLFFKHPFRHS